MSQLQKQPGQGDATSDTVQVGQDNRLVGAADEADKTVSDSLARIEAAAEEERKHWEQVRRQALARANGQRPRVVQKVRRNYCGC